MHHFQDWLCTDTLTGHGSTVWEVAFDKTGEQLVTCTATCMLGTPMHAWYHHLGNFDRIL